MTKADKVSRLTLFFSIVSAGLLVILFGLNLIQHYSPIAGPSNHVKSQTWNAMVGDEQTMCTVQVPCCVPATAPRLSDV
jgi:hypothetical protein